jgi:DnaJ-class molecular chaperone
MTSYYETLGVTRAFTANELKARWQELSRLHHPDRGGNAAVFAEVSRAYAILRDQKAKTAYDAAQELFTDPCHQCNGEGQTYKQKGFTARTAIKCQRCNGVGRLGRDN